MEIDSLSTEISLAFTYFAPLISSIRQTNVPTTGSVSVTVLGSNMGTFNSTLMKMSVHGTSTVQVKWTSDTCVVGLVSSHGLLSSLVTVSVSNQKTNPCSLCVISSDLPVLSAVSLRSVPTTGAVYMTMYGAGFSTADRSPVSSISGFGMESSSWLSGSSIVSKASNGVGSGRFVSIAYLNTAGSLTLALSFSSPRVSAISQGNGPAVGSVKITVFGSSYSTFGASGSGSFGMTQAPFRIWTSDSSVLLSAAEGVGRNLSVSVTIDDQLGFCSRMFSYDIPSVYRSKFDYAPSTGASYLTLSGLSFGTADYSNSASLFFKFPMCNPVVLVICVGRRILHWGSLSRQVWEDQAHFASLLPHKQDLFCMHSPMRLLSLVQFLSLIFL